MSDNYPPLDTERANLAFTLDPTPNDRVQHSLRVTLPEKERIDNIAEENGFPSRSAFIRTMMYMGMNTFVEQNPVNKHSEEEKGEEPVTIRDLVPEGEENAVDLTDEFYEDVLKDEMIDIVEQDPEIKRDGMKIYK